MLKAGRVHRVIYRAVDVDGALWCESSDPAEVREVARLGDTLQRLVSVVVTDGWQSWNGTPVDPGQPVWVDASWIDTPGV
jgi:hypothetical protein